MEFKLNGIKFLISLLLGAGCIKKNSAHVASSNDQRESQAPEESRVGCSSTPPNLSDELGKDVVNFESAMAMFSSSTKSNPVRFCDRSEFLKLFKIPRQAYLFAAGPSGLGFPNEVSELAARHLNDVWTDYLSQESPKNRIEAPLILSGISQTEAGFRTMDWAVEQYAVANPSFVVGGAIHSKAYAWPVESSQLPSRVQFAYLPGKKEALDYDMIAEADGMPVKALGVIRALEAGQNASVVVFDGGGISYSEASAVLKWVESNSQRMKGKLHVHLSFGWGFGRAKKISFPAAIKLQTTFSTGALKASGVALTMSRGPFAMLDGSKEVKKNTWTNIDTKAYLKYLADSLPSDASPDLRAELLGTKN